MVSIVINCLQVCKSDKNETKQRETTKGNRLTDGQRDRQKERQTDKQTDI